MSKHTATAFDFSDLSNKQQERIGSQVHNALKTSDILRVGESRHDDKLLHPGDSHKMAQGTSIHSWGSYHKLESQARTFCKYCWSEYGIRNVNQIKPQMVQSFIDELGERAYSRNTIDAYASGVNRFANVLDRAYGGHRTATWGKAVDNVRSTVLADAPRKDTVTRAYERPDELISSIKGEGYQVAARLQLECGLRVSDALKLRELRETGSISNSKGGQVITPHLSDSLKTALFRLEGSELNPTRQGYTNALKNACLDQNTAYQGTHGLRHNYAQAQYNGYRAMGANKGEALQMTSEDMGHHRQDITLTYLR